MSKVKKERLWYLKTAWGRNGWCVHRFRGIKKWDMHVVKLIKDGLLEKDPDGYMYRITEAGLKEIQ